MRAETLAPIASTQSTTTFDRVLAIALGVAMLGFAGVKIAYGYRDGLEIGPATYYTASAVEAVAGMLLISRRFAVLGAGLTAVFFVTAIAYAWISGVTSCGCLGPLRLASEHYRMIAATLGLLATLLVHRHMTAPRSA